YVRLWQKADMDSSPDDVSCFGGKQTSPRHCCPYEYTPYTPKRPFGVMLPANGVRAMTLMSFFCRLINGRCAQEPREPERDSHPKTQSTAASSAPYPSPLSPEPRKLSPLRERQGAGVRQIRKTHLAAPTWPADD